MVTHVTLTMGHKLEPNQQGPPILNYNAFLTKHICHKYLAQMSGLLRNQFSSVEETFLTSLMGGLPAMESFAHFWSGLQSTFAEGIKQQILDEETLPHAHEVAFRVKTMTELLLDLYEKSDTFREASQNDLAPFFSDLSIDGQLRSPSHPTPPKPG